MIKALALIIALTGFTAFSVKVLSDPPHHFTSGPHALIPRLSSGDAKFTPTGAPKPRPICSCGKNTISF